MTIKKKLILAFGIFILLISCIIMLNQSVTNQAKNRYEKLRVEIQPAIKSIDKFMQVNNFLQLLIKQKTNEATGHDVILDNKIDAIVEVEIPNLVRVFTEIEIIANDKEIKKNLSSVIFTTNEISDQVKVIKGHLRSKKNYLDRKNVEKCLYIYNHKISPRAEKVNRDLFNLKREYNDANLQLQKDLKTNFSDISFLILVFGSIGIVIGIGIAIQTVKSILKPIEKLKESAAIIGKGDYNHQLEISGADELSDLKKSFNQMSTSLKESFDVIKKQQEQQEITNTIKSAKNILYESLKGDLSVHEITTKTLSFFINFFEIRTGAFYIKDENGILVCESFHNQGSLAEVVANVPEGDLNIDYYLRSKKVIIPSSMNDLNWDSSLPNVLSEEEILLIPIQFANEAIGLIELVMIKAPKEIELNFIKEVNESIGLAIIAAQSLSNLEQAHDQLEGYSTELKLKNKELEEFVYITSHDLQEPLRTITSYSEILEEDYKDSLDTEGLGYIRFLQKASSRLSKQINSLLQLSRIGKASSLEKVNFKEIFTDVKTELSFLINEKKGELIFPKGEISLIEGSSVEIQSLFQNLIVNGFKYNTNENPWVEISVVEDNDSLTFCVSDNGIGIQKQHHKKVFKIFQRLDNGEGTGIGLAHCKKIVESHNGKIWLTSEVEIGSKFYFKLQK